MGKRRLAAGIVFGCVGLAAMVGSIVLGFLLISVVDTEIVMDEGDMEHMVGSTYRGRVLSESLDSDTRVRILSKTMEDCDFNLIVRDPTGWIVKNHTDRTPFNKNLVFSTTLIGYYEFRLTILTENITLEDIEVDIMGTEVDPLASSACSLMSFVTLGGGLMFLVGIALTVSHFMGLAEDEQRLKTQPGSVPIIVLPKQEQGPVRQEPAVPPGVSKYQHAMQLEFSGRYLEAIEVYQSLDLPLDAARCQSLYDNTR